jgi:hypothetical protein
MPKKTNQFQELVALIERSLAPQDARVTESALLSGDQREIDVLIESKTGAFTMKVAVEAKDERRKMDIVRFESLIGKYSSGSGVVVDKVVVINRAGFSKQVRERAKREGITLHTLDEALVADWASAANQRLLFRVSPHVSHIEFDPAVDPTEASLIAATARIVCTCCGREHGTPMLWGQRLLTDPDLVHELVVSASRVNGQVCRRATWEVPGSFRLRCENVDRAVRSMTAHLHCTVARGQLAVAAYRHGDSVVHHFSTSVAGNVVQFVVPNGPHSDKIAVRVSAPEAVSVTAPPPLASSTKADPPAPVHVSSPLFPKVLQRLSESLNALDARIEPGPIVHSLTTGEDVHVDAAVYLYPFAGIRLCTAILIRDADDADGQSFEAKVRKVLGCEIDRLLVINRSQCGVSRSIAGRHIEIDLKAFEADPITNVVPETLFWVRRVPTLTASLWGCDQPLKGTTWDGAKLRVGETFVTLEVFASRLSAVIQRAAIGSFVNGGAPQSAYGEKDLSFGFQLPVGTYITNRQRDYAVSSVKGIARIDGLATVLDRAIIDRTKTPRIILSSSTGPFWTSIGSLPRNLETVEFLGPNDHRRPYLGSDGIPSKDFDNFWAGLPVNENAPAGTSPYKVATVNLKREGWEMQILPVRTKWELPATTA